MIGPIQDIYMYQGGSWSLMNTTIASSVLYLHFCAESCNFKLNCTNARLKGSHRKGKVNYTRTQILDVMRIYQAK